MKYVDPFYYITPILIVSALVSTWKSGKRWQYVLLCIATVLYIGILSCKEPAEHALDAAIEFGKAAAELSVGATIAPTNIPLAVVAAAVAVQSINEGIDHAKMAWQEYQNRQEERKNTEPQPSPSNTSSYESSYTEPSSNTFEGRLCQGYEPDHNPCPGDNR